MIKEPLEDIGFYTLSDKRARESSASSRMMRCELLLTSKCNFKCSYCKRRTEKDLNLNNAKNIISMWKAKNIRFSGGEPLLYKGINELVVHAIKEGAERVAISTNGSFSLEKYKELINNGVNDFSISLDSAKADLGDKIAGKLNSWKVVVENIKAISELVYVTIGVVLTEDNIEETEDIINFAHSLGVADIRIISAAQSNNLIPNVNKISRNILEAHPILKYRINNIKNHKNMRGLTATDCCRCHLVLDDSVIEGGNHYPCVIYMREGGAPIGKVNSGMRGLRNEWSLEHDTFNDPICRANCLDVL